MANSKYHGVYETSSEGSDDLESELRISRAKLCAIFTCLVFLALLCVANLLILAVMYEVLDIGLNGMRSISFFKPNQHTRWLLETDLETVLLPDGVLSGFADQNLNIFGDNGQDLTLSASLLSESTISLTSLGTVMKTNNFKFVNPTSKKSILDFDENRQLSVVGEFGGKKIVTNGVKTPRVVSPYGKDLNINSRVGGIFLTGNEGVYMDGKVLNISADADISFKVENSVNNLVVDGMFALNYQRAPNSKGSFQGVTNATRYRLCVCTKTGALFRYKIPDESPYPTCAIAMENPC